MHEARNLIQTLLKHDLVDVFQVMICPVLSWEG